jgi:hypothetical protein
VCYAHNNYTTPGNAFGEKPRRFLKDKYTMYAAVLMACGISVGRGHNDLLTPQQVAEVFELLDKPNPLKEIEDYLEALDVLSDE